VVHRLVGLALLAATALAGPAAAQRRFPPDSFTNLQVLPKNIDRQQLVATMRGFATSLGVRCTYCHVGPRDDAPLDSLDFANDDKRTKRVARAMLHMVQHINGEHLQEVPEPRATPRIEVRCITCHRGVARPRLLDEELAITLADSGLEAATRRYRALRERFYGSGSYDFREQTLNQLAQAELRAGGTRRDNAMGVLQLNAEFYPTSPQIPFLMGEVLLQKGDTAAALASYRTALQRDSTMGPARQRVRALTGGGAPPRRPE
jgi:photosynthetic reaction center cytochrome c subunit